MAVFDGTVYVGYRPLGPLAGARAILNRLPAHVTHSSAAAQIILGTPATTRAARAEIIVTAGTETHWRYVKGDSKIGHAEDAVKDFNALASQANP